MAIASDRTYIVCPYEREADIHACITALGNHNIVGTINLDIDHQPSFEPCEFADDNDRACMEHFCARCGESGCDWLTPTYFVMHTNAIDAACAIIAAIYGVPACTVDDYNIWCVPKKRDFAGVNVVVLTELWLE